ncbi:MAG TPA: hypothetical protein DCM40_18865, partial [Maribacter sp.]|nr:hypothetical protein [Maribacter sp.]
DSNSSLMIQWQKSSGKPYVYPVVSSLQKNKKYFVAAEGDGRVVYPNISPKYRCISPFENDEVKEELLASELVETNAVHQDCVTKGGRWVIQDEEFVEDKLELGNRDSFEAIKGLCKNSNGEVLETLQTEESCVDPVDGSTNTTWEPYLDFKTQKDSLHVYASATTADLSLPIQVIFNEDNLAALTPKPTNNVSTSNVNVLPLTYPLKPEQVIRFPQQSSNGSGPLPCFIIKEPEATTTENKYDFTKKEYQLTDTEIVGILLYDSVASNSEGTEKRTGALSLESSVLEADANGGLTTISDCVYYAEPVEIIVSSAVNEGDSVTVTFDSLSTSFSVGELIFLKHSSGNCQLKVVSYDLNNNQITGKLVCPHGSNVAAGAKAKLVGKNVGHYSVNQSFENESIIEAVSGKPVVRFKKRTLLQPVTSTNILTLEAVAGKLREIVALGSSYSSFDLSAGSYTLRGRGFMTVNGVDYYPAATGKIGISHEAGSGSYYEGGNDNSGSGAASVRVGIKNSPIHMPVGTVIEFPAGSSITLTDRVDVGDVFINGNVSGKIYHNEESNNISVSASDTLTLSSTTSVVLTDKIIVCFSQDIQVGYDSSNAKYFNVEDGKSYFVDEMDDTVYADYFSSREILSGNKFKIEKLVDESREDKTKLNFGDVNGSEARYDYEAKGKSFIYMLPISPVPHIESFGKVYKITHEYKQGSENFNVPDNDYTYKVGGKGEGYATKSSSNYDIGQDFTGAGQVTLVPSSPTVYEKKTTTLQPNKY